jgi:hypothetical protein
MRLVITAQKPMFCLPANGSCLCHDHHMRTREEAASHHSDAPQMLLPCRPRATPPFLHGFEEADMLMTWMVKIPP